MWVKSSDCAQVITDNWDSDLDLLGNIGNCQVGLMNWESTKFGFVRRQIKEYKDRLENLHSEPNTGAIRAQRK